MVLRKLSQTFKVTLALMLSVLSSGLTQLYSAPLAAAANDGTLKVHRLGSASGKEDNEPKVCAFDFEGFGFDDDQSGLIKITPQGNDSGTTDSLELNFGPADANGYAKTDDVNNGGATLDNGHYKSTLYGKDVQGTYTIDLKAKSKVFKVECPAEANYLETWHEAACGQVTIYLHNVSPWVYPVSYTTDGSTPDINGPKYGPVVNNLGSASDDQTGSKTLTFPEDSGEVTVKYVVAAGTESDLYVGKSVGQVTTLQVQTDCLPPAPVNPCEANYFTDYKMWEITWGTQHTDTNGVSTFDMQSHGGLVSVNNKPVPSYMTPDWHWLYVTEAEVNNGRTVTYGFADGTIITAVVSANANNCPAVEWTTTPPPTVTICEEALPTIHSTNLDQNGWTLPMDAAYVDGGIKLNVSGTNPDTSWDETYIERSFVGPLADIGDQIDFTASPEQYVGIHIVTDKGVLVYEKEGSYAGMWWSTSDFGATASGMGYATFDTLENIVAKNPGVMTSALRILYTNPAATSSTVNSVTVGCAIYTFSHEDDKTPTNPGNVLGDNDNKTPTTGKVLSTSTVLPATLPATGGSTTSPFMIIIAALMAYGAAYFLQGRRILARNEIEV